MRERDRSNSSRVRMKTVEWVKMENSVDKWSYCNRGIKLGNEYEPAFLVIYGNNQSVSYVRSRKESNTLILALITGVCWILSIQYLRRITGLRYGGIARALSAKFDRHFCVGIPMSQMASYLYGGISRVRKNKLYG